LQAVAKNPNLLQTLVHKVNKLTYKYWMAIPVQGSLYSTKTQNLLNHLLITNPIQFITCHG